ncbi:MAG TPA: BNR-4 repeat-containing protein, partial [Rhizobium sp.]
PRLNMICRSRVPSRFGGWDSHKSVILAFDANGRLQVAGNMHDSPLVYAAADKPDDISAMILRPMIGRNESSVTYPIFMNSFDGALYFAYRSGVSGNGEWFTNVFRDSSWRRVSNTPLFSSAWGGRPTSAYPSAIRLSEDNYIHLAIVWRRTFDVSTNYAITYGRTSDFVHWTNHEGYPINLPLDPGNSDLIESPGVGSGLVNSARVNLAQDGTPIIAYTRYGSGGRNVLVLASPSGKGWHRSVVAVAARRTVMQGGGSVPDLPIFGDSTFYSGGIASIDVTFPGEARRRIFFNAENLVTTAPPKTIKPAKANLISLSPPPNLVDIREMTRNVRRSGTSDTKNSAGSIVYFSQGINRDQKRTCTPTQPTACDPPPSPLIFIPN